MCETSKMLAGFSRLLVLVDDRRGKRSASPSPRTPPSCAAGLDVKIVERRALEHECLTVTRSDRQFKAREDEGAFDRSAGFA